MLWLALLRDNYVWLSTIQIVLTLLHVVSYCYALLCERFSKKRNRRIIKPALVHNLNEF